MAYDPEKQEHTDPAEPTLARRGTGSRLGRVERLRRSGIVRELRLRRRVAMAKLKHSDGFDEAVRELRRIVAEAPPEAIGERRKASEALARILDTKDPPQVSVDARSQHLNVTLPGEAIRAWLEDPTRRAEALQRGDDVMGDEDGGEA